MQFHPTRYYSHGKLLLSGEYVILDGAVGLALPTKAGQSLEADSNDEGVLKFTSTDEQGHPWFTATIIPEKIVEAANSAKTTPEEAIANTTDMAVAVTLVKMLLCIYREQPEIFKTGQGINLISRLEFPRDWGLGSSSTFINNLAQWSNTNPYAILKASLGGSGYDIACAASDTPLTFALVGGEPITKAADFNPAFQDDLYFIHLNKKQNSRKGIASYRALTHRPEKAITEASEITRAMLECNNTADFGKLLDRHENLIGNLLDMNTVKESLFPDYPGHLKSLGAWGGDFILATASEDPTAYFKEKGYHTVLPYREMIL